MCMLQVLYMCMFIFVNVWTISIHDGLYISVDGIVNRLTSL